MDCNLNLFSLFAYFAEFMARNVMVQVMSKLYALSARWRDSLPEFMAPPFRMDVSQHAVKNTRRKMEDKHLAFQDVNLLYGLKVIELFDFL